MKDEDSRSSGLVPAHELAWHRISFLNGTLLLINATAYLPVLMAVGLGSIAWYWLAWPIVGLAVTVAVKASLGSRQMDDDLRFLKFMSHGTICGALLSAASSAACHWGHNSLISVVTDIFVYAMAFGMMFILMGPLELLIPMRPFGLHED